jgi:hypothetical protein
MLFLAALLLATVICAPVVLIALAVQPAPAAVLRRAVAVSDEQPLALAALVAFRAPPA